MSIGLSDLDRVVSLLNPVIHPTGQGGVVVHKTSKADGSGYVTRILWVAPGDERFLTQGPDDGAPAFSADGAWLYFVRKTSPGAQIFRLPLDGGEPEAYGPKWLGLSTVLPLPADEGLVIVAAALAGQEEPVPTWPRHYERWQWQFDGKGYFGTDPSRLFLVRPGREPEVLDPSPYDVGMPALSPDGRFVVYTRIRDEDAAQEARTDLFRVNLQHPASGPECLTEGPFQYGAPAVAADGSVWAYGNDRECGPASIGKLFRRAADGSVDATDFGQELEVGQPLSSDFHVPVGMGAPRPAGSGLFVLATGHGETGIWQVSGDALPIRVDTAIPVVYEMSATRTANGPAVLYVGASLEALDAVYLWHDGETTRLTDDNAWAGECLRPTATVTVTGQDSLPITAYVTGIEKGIRRPAILLVHGGPHGAYGQTTRFDAQVMAEHYVVIQVNPRGSMGYGQAFMDAVRGDWGGKDMADLMAVVDHLIEEGAVDPDRLYVTGGSYGGFMTAWIVGHTERFRAASSVVPVTNLVSFYGTSDIGWWFAPGEVGPDLWADPKRLWEQSPLAYAPSIKTPTQVIAGEDDRRCPIEQAEQLYTALKRFSVDTEFLRYPGPHGFGSLAKPSLRKDRLERVLAWFQRYA